MLLAHWNSSIYIRKTDSTAYFPKAGIWLGALPFLAELHAVFAFWTTATISAFPLQPRSGETPGAVNFWTPCRRDFAAWHPVWVLFFISFLFSIKALRLHYRDWWCLTSKGSPDNSNGLGPDFVRSLVPAPEPTGKLTQASGQLSFLKKNFEDSYTQAPSLPHQPQRHTVLCRGSNRSREKKSSALSSLASSQAKHADVNLSPLLP